MVAAAISIPLLLAGIYIASSAKGTSASMGRPNGLLQPPVCLSFNRLIDPISTGSNASVFCMYILTLGIAFTYTLSQTSTA